MLVDCLQFWLKITLCLLNKWGYCRDYRDLCLWFEEGARFQMHSSWRRTFKCYFMQLSAWHGAQCCWVEVIISLKCLGGCLQGTTSYAVARGKENSIALTTTDQSSHITLQLRKGCRSEGKTDQTLQAFIHASFLLVMRSNNKNHNREKAPLKVAFEKVLGHSCFMFFSGNKEGKKFHSILTNRGQ